jgi:hypothetical protein
VEEGKESESVSMWNLDHAVGQTPTNNGHAAVGHGTKASASGSASAHRPLLALLSALLLALAIVLPVATLASRLPAPSAGSGSLSGSAHAQACAAATCAGDESSGSGVLALAAPTCEPFCARIQQVYHDARTQELLVLLAQTPTGQGALTYLLAMGAHFGDSFITWRDLRADGLVGKNNAGGFIQLNSAMHTENDEVRFFMAGILVHETVESSFDVGEGIRVMGTRHADYVAQWFNGEFERELHALPYYHAQDPFYDPAKNSAYRLTYDAWLYGADDGRAYLSNPEQSDLRHSDRKGRAWPSSDWWAEQGGFWLLGQGTDVAPVPNPLGLSPAMLVASDLSVLVR